MNLHRTILKVAALLFLTTVSVSGQTWTLTSAPLADWVSVASSSDGTKLVATAIPVLDTSLGGIYLSTNSGATWELSTAPVTNWYASKVASSAEGSILVESGESFIYISTNSGANWQGANVSSSIGGSWNCLACSADGRTILAGNVYSDQYTNVSQILISTNLGTTWSSITLSDDYLLDLVASADGMKMVGLFANYSGTSNLIRSADMGTTWLYGMVPSLAGHLASSGDGTKLVVANGGYIYISTDSAGTWNELELTNAFANYVACSADGSKLVGTGSVWGPWWGIFTSSDSGTTWAQANVTPLTNFSAVASSADGSSLVAVTSGGGVYTGQAIPTPVLSVAPSGSGILVSWTVPSMNFVLQEATDLTSGKWTSVPVIPSLNYSNLQYQVAITRPQGMTFYRLASQ